MASDNHLLAFVKDSDEFYRISRIYSASVAIPVDFALLPY